MLVYGDNNLDEHWLRCWPIFNWTLMNKLQWYLKNNTVSLIPEYAFENVCIIKVEDRKKIHGWIVSECIGQINKSDDVISMPYAFQGMPSMKAVHEGQGTHGIS